MGAKVRLGAAGDLSSSAAGVFNPTENGLVQLVKEPGNRWGHLFPQFLPAWRINVLWCFRTSQGNSVTPHHEIHCILLRAAQAAAKHHGSALSPVVGVSEYCLEPNESDMLTALFTSLNAALGSVTTTLPKVGVGSLAAFVASFSFSFWAGVCSLISAGALLWLRYHMEGKEKDKQRQHEANEADKERKHKAREWDKVRKKEITLALISAGAQEAKVLAMTVA